MALHGKKRHLKRLAAPAAQPILRKKHIWLASALPGPHAKAESVPLVVLLRDMLEVAHSVKEAERIVGSKQVLIDGKPATDIRHPVGLMDVISLPKLNASFILLKVRGKLATRKASNGESKLCKITGKKLIGKDTYALTLHDGRSIVVKEKGYAVGDTLRLAIPKQKILEHIALAKGARCYVYKGRHAGAIGKLEAVIEFPGITSANAKMVDENGAETTTLKEYVLVVDKDFKV